MTTRDALSDDDFIPCPHCDGDGFEPPVPGAEIRACHVCMYAGGVLPEDAAAYLAQMSTVDSTKGTTEEQEHHDREYLHHEQEGRGVLRPTHLV